MTALLRVLLLAVLVMRADATLAEESNASDSVIRWNEARDHIGEKVVVEGSIVATHASPLSILLSFDESFNVFTAVIRPADIGTFPPDPAEYYRGKKVRVRGRIEEYGKKAEIVVRNPRQIEIVEPEVQRTTPARPDEGYDTQELSLAILNRLAEIGAKLDDIADRLDLLVDAIDRQQAQPEGPATYLLPGSIPSREPPPRPRYEQLRSLKRGMKAAEVEKLMGPPAFVDPNSEGGEVWYYGSGRSLTFNPRGRIEAMSGFRHR